MKEYIKLSLFQLRKKSNIFTIILITLAFTLIVIVGTYTKSMNSHFDKYDSRLFRTFSVGKKGSNISEHPEEREKIMSELYSLNHVLMVIPDYIQYDYVFTDSLKYKNDYKTVFRIEAANNDTLPEIVKGTNFPDDEGYYMVCPEHFYPEPTGKPLNEYTIEDRMPIDDYFRKTVTHKYVNHINTEEFSMNIKVIGLYKSSSYASDEMECYVNIKTLTDINDNKFKGDLDLEGVPMKNAYVGFYVQIDSNNNYDEFSQNLEKLGYNYERLGGFDVAGIEEENETAVMLMKAIAGMSFVLMVFLLMKDFKEDKKHYDMMFYLGYTKKEVKKVYFVSTTIKLLFCLLIAFIISFIIVHLLQLAIVYFPYLLGKWKIVYSFESTFMIIVACIVAEVICAIVCLDKIKVK